MQKSISEPRQKNLKGDDLQQLKDPPGALSFRPGHGLTKTGPPNIRKTSTCFFHFDLPYFFILRGSSCWMAQRTQHNIQASNALIHLQDEDLT